MGNNQPPPLGLRPPPELQARIEAYAASRGIRRHAAMLELIEAGLRVSSVSFAGTDVT
jgi:hypothetical protein